MAVEYISGKDHYDKVVARVASVRKSLWIGTADIKDFHVKAGNSLEPFLRDRRIDAYSGLTRRFID